MSRIIRTVAATAMTASVLAPVIQARTTYESENSHVGTYATIADEQADTSVRDYYSGRTFTDMHDYATFKRLPIGDAMDASATGIDALIALATAADAGITVENYYGDRSLPPSMSGSVFADTIVEACGVVADSMTFDSNRARAASTCERLSRGHVDYERAGAWFHAIAHFRRTCETRHAIIADGTAPDLVRDYLDRTEPRTLDYIVPTEAVDAGDPGALKAKPLAERWLARIDATATKDACLTYSPALAKPLHVNENGSLVVDHRDTRPTAARPSAEKDAA